MKFQRLLSLTRQAVDQYLMIADGDRIAIGISGGKDSLALLYALQGLQRFYPKKYELQAITVNLGFAGFDLSPVQDLCRHMAVPYTIIDTEIGKILFETRKESNPCALCAKLRKGVLNAKAKELGCNKVAYAHHKDDFIETMMLSLIFEGRFYSFSPYTYLDQTELTVIRPLIYVEESEVISIQNRFQFPVCKNPCTIDGHTKREYVKNITRQLEEENPGVKSRFFHAIVQGQIEGWPKKLNHLK